MNIGIIGSGGREHSICYKLKESVKNNLFCFPGNAGTKNLAENVNIDPNDFNKLYSFVKKKNIELIIVGPEQPLVNGIVDFFNERNIKVFGPKKKASQLEGSKIFMKNFCKKNLIPTASYIEAKNLKDAEIFLEKTKFPVVVKSDGLAAGKGVTICENKKQALRDVEEILNGKFKTSSKVILEEFLLGEEASYFVITDGKNFKSIGTAQDHKKIGEGDTGLNTGGMGAYSPSMLIDNEIEQKIINKIILPTIRGMEELGSPYKGILYAGLMINHKEPKLIEYNIRFGDPECQILMMRLESDLLEIIMSVFNNSLNEKQIKWKNFPGMTIVAASKGYPGNFEKNIEIKNINSIHQNEYQKFFHAGTIIDQEGKLITNGGRVLNSTVISSSLKDARTKALKMLDQLNWSNKYYRRDIGFKILDK